MKLRVIKIKDIESKRGDYRIRYFFMKDLESGKSYRTCTGDEFRNWYNWCEVEVGDVLEGDFILYGSLVDADSDFNIIKKGGEKK